MDLNFLVWFIGVCLAIQRNAGHLFILRVESNNQGTKQIEHLIEIE